MKNLLEIARILTKKKVNKIEIFDQYSLKHKNSKFNEFYEALMEGRFKNDRDAAAHLYSCSPTDDKYRQLKSRFKKRLLNTLFFLDVNQPATSNYERAFFSCQKDWTLINLLLSYGATNTAAMQARQLLNTALKFKFTDMIVHSAGLLRDVAAKAGEEKDFDQYNAYLQTYLPIWKAELQSEEYLQRIRLWYGSPAGKTIAEPGEMERYCQALTELTRQHSIVKIHLHAFLAWIYWFEMQKDFKGMLHTIEQAETYLHKNRSFITNRDLTGIYVKKMAALLHIQDFRQGKKLAEQHLDNIPAGSLQWFEFMEYYVLLALHTENILPALAIYQQVIEQKQFKKLNPETREKWSIMHNYLNYFIESRASENPVLLAQRQKVFHVNRFLNDPLLYSKDQRIYTVLQVMLQLLFLLEKRNFNQAMDRIERLKSYTARQLKKPQYERLLHFVRLLQQLARARFNPASLSNIEKHHHQLLEKTFLYRGQIDELEILRYEQLWKLILQRLEK